MTKENLQISMSGLCITSVHRYVCSIVVHFHVWQSMNKMKFKYHVCVSRVWAISSAQ